MSNQASTAIDPDYAVSAFFESREAAESAETKLKKAGYAADVIYLVPRAPGVTVTVVSADRIEEATEILRNAGGDMREADINASGSVMFRLSPREIIPDAADERKSEPRDDAPRRSSTDEDGAGVATGGALW